MAMAHGYSSAPPLAAVYARFSSDRQRDTSIEDQVRRCREHIEREQIAPPEAVAVFTDFAFSGASLDRPGFEQLMRQVEDGRISTIVTEDVSRISRDFADAALIFRRLQFAKVPLISIADGINTSSRHAKLSFALKSLVADIYLDDLRDKTLRGLEGRARAGYATGMVPYGFRTRPDRDGGGNVRGSRIELVPREVEIVRRIFREHLDGRSLAAIARRLNDEGIPSPRTGSKHKRFGWSAGTIRAMLYNERYAGIWRFKQREWVRVPGSRKRLPRQRAAGDVITLERPELRIIDAEAWHAVQVSLRTIHRRYTQRGARTPGPRNRSTYLLSGILRCGACGAPMVVNGSTNVYYVCGAYRSKGTCAVRLAVREDETRATLVRFLQDVLHSSAFRARREQLLVVEQGQSAHLRDELVRRQDRLADAEERATALIAELGRAPSDRIADAVRQLEAEVAAHQAAIARMKRAGEQPEVMAAKVLRSWLRHLGSRGSDVARDRTRLAAWLREATLHVRATADGARLQGSLRLDALLLVDHDPSTMTEEIAVDLALVVVGPRGAQTTSAR
ncbi:MAG: recombinase family protein [Deltaproteobacteria bacterium]|nr:recombinase family protein [Kofleriaceae bacterium]